MRYNRNYFISALRDRFGNNNACRNMIATTYLVMNEQERLTWTEFNSRFEFLVA